MKKKEQLEICGGIKSDMTDDINKKVKEEFEKLQKAEERA